MRILFVFYYPSGGVETLARERSQALNSKGVFFHFLYYQKGPGLQNITREKTFVTNEDEEIKKILKKGNYQCIIVCSDHRFLKRAHDLGYTGPIIYEVQGLGSFQQADNWLKTAQPVVETYATAILYPETPHLIHLIDLYYPTLKKFSFHNCIDTNLFSYRRKRKLSNPIIGWVGRIEDNKNWEFFLEVCARLVKIKDNLRIWIFEDDTLSPQTEREKFNEKLQELQLLDKLKIYKNIPHKKMAVYYSMIGDSGGFLCSTSKVEGFGYAVLEAMSCRCPVLCSNSDGILSFLIHNQTGKLFPQNDLDSAVEEAIKLLTSSSARSDLIKNAQMHVEQNFSSERYVENFMNMLNELNIHKK